MRLYALAYLSENESGEQTTGIIDVCRTKAEAVELRAKLRAQDASRQYLILRFDDQRIRLEIPKA